MREPIDFFHDGTKPFTCDADPLKLNCYGWIKLRPQSMLFLSLALSPVSVIILISRPTSNQCPKWSTLSSGSLVPLAHSSVNNSFSSPVAHRPYWLFDWHEIPSSTDCRRCLVLQQCVAKVNYSTFNKARNYTVNVGPRYLFAHKNTIPMSWLRLCTKTITMETSIAPT